MTGPKPKRSIPEQIVRKVPLAKKILDEIENPGSTPQAPPAQPSKADWGGVKHKTDNTGKKTYWE